MISDFTAYDVNGVDDANDDDDDDFEYLADSGCC